MQQQFVNIKREPVDLIQHCIEQRVAHPHLTVHLGCDSVVVGGQIYYVTVVAFRYGRNGAHFIFNKTKVPSYRKSDGKPDIFTRLMHETKSTIDLVQFLTERNIFIKEMLVLEFDFNNMRETKSREHVAIASGWASGFGYENVYLKSDQQVACKAANQICQSC